MNKINSPDTLAALALVPEQLPSYVRGVAGSELRFANGFAVYLGGGAAVLVAAPLAGEPEHPPGSEVDAAVAEVSAWPGVERISVLGVERPASAPVGGEGYTETHDAYLALDLPYAGAGDNFAGVPWQKLRNMLRRASRELEVGVEPWGAECQAIVREYTGGRALEAGTRYIFEHLEKYAADPGVKVFTARRRGGEFCGGGPGSPGTLEGLCIGDFTPLATAFYMFAFRRRNAPPGTADLLLHALVLEAQRQGHERVNLGLEINGGIGFFKRKWGARPFLPLVECSWPVRAHKKSFFKTLFG